MKHIILTIFILFVTSCAGVNKKNFGSVSGHTYEGKSAHVNLDSGKASVVVFISATCPCSNSHIPVLKALKEKYQSVQFVGVHSNADERGATAKMYFEAAGLNFPVIKDSDSAIAKKFGALKTPHAFVFNGNGELLYQGAVTNTSVGTRSKENYLDQALSAVNEGRVPAKARHKTLGCYISLKD